MQRKHRILTLICCASTAVVSGCGKPDADDSPASAPLTSVSIIPAPRHLLRTSGQFAVTTATSVMFDDGSAAEAVAQYFVDLLQRTGGPALQTDVMSPAAEGGIKFQLNAGESSTAEEAYTLAISPSGVSVSAASSRGLFYGAVTLWQLMTPGARDGEVLLPAMKIEDAPRFRWRGLMLDSARHFQSPEFIKQFIDWMALHKFSVLHWHLTDDQAWRLEIKKYPRLTSVGAWRVPAGAAAAADIDPATGKPRLYGGFYSQDEVRDIVAYAAARHITIVPEIEMPGHASAPVVAYPQLGAGKAPAAVPSDWGIYSMLYNIDDSTFAFLEDVLTETMALFPSEYIHVGGDEAVKDQWQASPKIQAQMRKLGVKDEHALQSYFIQRIEKFLNANGRKLIGWDEILDGGLAPNATVMSWRGIDGAVAAAKAGHDTVLSPGPALYFDNRQSAWPDTAPGRGRVISVEDVYRFDPAPPSLTGDQRKHILGVQANLWTEHMRSEARVEYMAFPRAAAVAEVAWTAEDRMDWTDFESRLPAMLARYERLGIRYAAPTLTLPRFAGEGTASSGQSPEPSTQQPFHRTSHQLDTCSDKLVLSLEDDAPLHGERAVFLVDVMEPCWIFRAADLTHVDAIKVAVGQVPFNFQIGQDVHKIPLPPPATAEGELEVRLDRCDGEKLATIPLAPAVASPTVTPLPPHSIEPRAGAHDLCFIFTRRDVDPIWVIDSVELVGKQ